MPISQNEYLSISDKLHLEELLIKKYKMFCSICTDQQLKIKCEEIVAQHQNNYNNLMKQLN